VYDGNVENDPFEQFLKAFTLAELQEQRRNYIELMREYESRVTALSALIEIVEGIEARRDRNAAAGRRASPAPTSRRPSLGRAIQTVMASDGDRAWTTDELLTALKAHGWAPGGKTPRNSLDATLSRLARNGSVERRGSGIYALPTTKQTP
jgi:hypothetical protein